MMSLNFHAADSVLLMNSNPRAADHGVQQVALVHRTWRGTLLLQFYCIKGGGLALPSGEEGWGGWC